LVLVPAGWFIRGTTAAQAAQLAAQYGYDFSWFASEVPANCDDLPGFFIRKYPVTVGEYAYFCAKTGHPKPLAWNSGPALSTIVDHPVAGVTRDDAEAYATWCGMRLPTESEWEKAARGPNGLIFPWGDVFDPTACTWGKDPTMLGPWTSPVTAHPNGASYYGVMDMVGNVAEYCSDGPDKDDVYIKGGAWMTTEIVNLRAAARNMTGSKLNASNFYGFRCAKDLH
jgi:formylglycine-generating enzyme required for sulfatase activity